MRTDIWEARAASLEPYNGKGLSAIDVARMAGISVPTVKRYAKRYGFDFGGNGEPKIAKLAERLKELAAEGKTRSEAAAEVGISATLASTYAMELGIKFRHGGKRLHDERAEPMAAMYKGGKTLDEIGKLYGLTRERVRQLIKKYCGLTGADGGISASAERKRLAAMAKKDAASFAKHGCSHAQYIELMRLGTDLVASGIPRCKTPTGAFQSQRRNALARGIEWNLTLWDWWQVWQKSGKWDRRGRGKEAFVMCRFKDDGAYDVGNVYIATHSHNSSFQPNNPYRKGHPDHDKVMAKHRVNLSAAVRQRPIAKRVHKDLPVGVTRSGRYLQAQIGINGKNNYIGTFKTVEEAHAAYLNALAAIEARAAA